ncbi:MinD/ParA family ATP-binding protein [Microbacterium memoriense]|uniref:Chromosome partitioning protein n=1 Tax=Microbacterium memoriense TaxID=2978350 RepID=A0ABT2PCN0_9MICO|nr:chromosome partitioning protein [Microbacterium memoriense]MCT9002329.1 chromosome partitioning protein [Microbacterium memoriense]
MTTTTYEPIVHITSSTAAELHVGGDVDELFASTPEGLRDRVVEAVRLLAASAGEPVTATLVDGAARWPLIVHPDGTYLEAPSLSDAPVPDASPMFEADADLTVPASPVAAATVTATPVDLTREPEFDAPEPVAPAVSEPAAPTGALRGSGIRRDPTQRVTPTVEDLLNSRTDRTRERATEGWQGAVRRMTGGAISPRPGQVERSRLDRERTVQRRLDAPRTIVILNPKGGAHKTTSTLLLAATFGTQRGGATLAWDNNETRGTLGWRAQNAPHHRTAVDLLEHLDGFTEPSQASLAALDTYVRTQVDARFDVLASDEDAAASSTIDAAAFDRLHGVLSRYYRLLIVDTGNNMRASNWVAAVAAADQLVIVSTIREDTAASAAWLLDGLREKGFDQKIDDAVTILAAPSARPDRKLAERLERHFAQVTSSVVHVPFDPALVDGGPIDFDALSAESRDAWLTVAAAVAERL